MDKNDYINLGATSLMNKVVKERREEQKKAREREEKIEIT